MAEAIDVEKRTRQYIALRDKIKEISDRHKAELKPYMDAMATLEGVFMQALDGINADNIKTEAGTIYKAVQASATVSDMSEFRRHVIGAQDWELVDWKANKTAVSERLGAGEVLPPGVKYSTHVKINVRRAGEK
jgi:hypothetical protein